MALDPLPLHTHSTAPGSTVDVYVATDDRAVREVVARSRSLPARLHFGQAAPARVEERPAIEVRLDGPMLALCRQSPGDQPPDLMRLRWDPLDELARLRLERTLATLAEPDAPPPPAPVETDLVALLEELVSRADRSAVHVAASGPVFVERPAPELRAVWTRILDTWQEQAAPGDQLELAVERTGTSSVTRLESDTRVDWPLDLHKQVAATGASLNTNRALGTAVYMSRLRER